MGLLAILAFVLTDMFISIVTSRLESEGYANVAEDGRFILARLQYDIMQASAITTPTNLGSTAATLSAVINGTTYTYAASNSALVLTNNFGTSNLTSSETSVSGISFLRVGNAGGKDTIQVTLTLSSKTQRSNGSPETQTFQTTVSRR